MYFTLGDIKFEATLGFESFTDTVEATYARHELINGKAKLQRTGDSLREFSGSINFHRSFCIPETEYGKLEAKRLSGEHLSLVYGNGTYEGDYVITVISRTPNQTDPDGNYTSLSCSITLVEAESGSASAQQKQEAKAKAFALNTNRPLPSNSDPKVVNNPAMSVANNNKLAVQSGSAISAQFDAVDKKVANVTAPVNLVIAQAQKFLELAPAVTSRVNRYINVLSNSLNSLNALTVSNPTINSFAPNLATEVTASKSVLLLCQALMTDIANLPSVSTVSDAIYVLNVQKNSLVLTKQLVDQLAKLNSASAGVSSALASKFKV